MQQRESIEELESRIRIKKKEVTLTTYVWKCPRSGDIMSSDEKPKCYEDYLSIAEREKLFEEEHQQWLSLFAEAHQHEIGAQITKIIPEDEYWFEDDHPEHAEYAEIHFKCQDGRKFKIIPNSETSYFCVIPVMEDHESCLKSK